MTPKEAATAVLEPGTDAAVDSTAEGAVHIHSSWRTGQDAHVVILGSGDEFFGIDINTVQEIVLMQEITAVPASNMSKPRNLQDDGKRRR